MKIDSLSLYYSHASYRNGFRRGSIADSCIDNEGSLNLISFETGFYGLQFDVQDLTKMWFQLFNNPISYESSVSMDQSRMNSLDVGRLQLEITLGTERYWCTTMRPSTDRMKPFNGTVILWEAGRVAQRFEILNLVFQNVDKKNLDGTFSLMIQVWPDVFALTLKAKTTSLATLQKSVTLKVKDWMVQQCFNSESFELTLPCNIKQRIPDAVLDVSTVAFQDIGISKKTQPFAETIALNTAFRSHYQAYETSVKYWYAAKSGCLTRTFKIGYTDIRAYDDYLITLKEGTSSPTPYMLSLSFPANVTGMCPILLTKDGFPTGIPVQISKNWHMAEKGSYATLYMVLPASGTYILRIVYGFYGTLPAASHAQLCLWGYGNGKTTGRWDQLAIGCWGETFCLDSEFSCVDGQITDVRGLMMGSNTAEQKWNWTYCAWGGDWLRAYASSKRLYVNHVKVAYFAHGPCLTHVRYYGYYGEDGAIKFEVGVRTLRTDDYCRTFLTFDYQIRKDISLENGYLHSMLQRSFHTPTVAFGNSEGLLKQLSIPNGLKANQVYVKNTSFEGVSPFWIAFPDSRQFPPKDTEKNQGTKNMIIQSFRANVAGQCFLTPAFSLVNEVSGWTSNQDDKPSVMVNLELPNGIQTMKNGDSIQMDIEWTTHSREADGYYGPNESYRSFLSSNPNSWKVTFRECQMNGCLLSVQVDKDCGKLVRSYPITVNVTNDDGVRLVVTGGTGAVPMEFCGLKHSDYRLYSVSDKTGEESLLDQSSHVGNDYWQTDYNFATATYTMTFNPMFGDDHTTKWRLKRYWK